MQYMGGKAKISRRVVAAVLSDTPERSLWFEPFVGGGNVLEKAAPHFARSVAADAHPDLILMWQAAVSGWTPPDLTRERYAELRNEDPSPERGFAGFGASFGGKWFGGYGVSPRDGEVWRASQRSAGRQAGVFRVAGSQFIHAPFGARVPPPGAVVYCDPPYMGTTGYSTGGFDHESFYRTLQVWASTGCYVYVSEYTVPDSVATRIVWSGEKRNVLDKGVNDRVAVENLFRILPAPTPVPVNPFLPFTLAR